MLPYFPYLVSSQRLNWSSRLSISIHFAPSRMVLRWRGGAGGLYHISEDPAGVPGRGTASLHKRFEGAG